MPVLETSAVITLVGWYVAPNIKELMDWARKYAVSRYKWYTGLQEKLQKLSEDLEEISCLAGASGSTFVNDPARIGRLWRLKDAIHDAEELLDTFEYQILEANRKKSRRDGKAATDPTVDHGNQVTTIGTDKSLSELNKLLKRLDKLCQSSRNLFQVSQHCVRPPSRQIRGPMRTKDELFGYRGQYADLLSKLTDGDAEVVAIIGHGGIGKTELARRAFNDEEVRGKFGLLIWACVYGKYTESELLREIWNSAAGAQPVGEMNVSSLQLQLANMVKSGQDSRYLLVLDDVCNDESVASVLNRKKWDEVLAPFKQHGGTGSRILITTRAEICSTTLDAGAHIVLSGIDDRACALLLKRTAFMHEADKLPRELSDAIENNLSNLHGSPLAAEEVGCMLKGNLDWRKWQKIMSGDHHNTVFQAHLSSYQDLPPHLQRCFAFCSIFPKAWHFKRAKLVDIWIALGFVEGPSETAGETTEEDVAGGYFDALLQRSLFQNAKVPGGCKKNTQEEFVIHEHIHSMLRLVSPNYYLSIDRSCDLPVSVRTVRHLSITTGCLGLLKGYPDGLKQLRTLLVFSGDRAGTVLSTSACSINVTANAILTKFKGARVLDFSDTSMTELPESTGELQHLRYLGLPKTIDKVGPHITKLLLLRFLKLSMKYISEIAGIGSLQKLQGSVEFQVRKSKDGHAIGELEKLNSLSQTLSITGLEEVQSKQEAESAGLAKKDRLKVLKLQWASGNVHQREELADRGFKVLDGLKPHPNLEDLYINGYTGRTTSPSWLEDACVLKNLASLYLRNCNLLRDLPCVGGLPLLKILEIKGLPSVRKINDIFCGSGEFRSLEKVVLDDMPELEAWDDLADGAPILFPKLRKVRIVDCNKLSSLSGLRCCSNTLKYLEVNRCGKFTTFSRRSFPYLLDLHILRCGCPDMVFQES